MTSCAYTPELTLKILPSAASMCSNTNLIFPKYVRLWFGLHEPAARETGWAKRDAQMQTQTDVDPIKKIMHDTHTHRTKHRQKDQKGRASLALTQWQYVLWFVVPVPIFHTMGCYIMEKDREQALGEQQGAQNEKCSMKTQDLRLTESGQCCRGWWDFSK